MWRPVEEYVPFWSSVDLTGNQTRRASRDDWEQFWSSVDLTGNQTFSRSLVCMPPFWSSVDLTGNQTRAVDDCHQVGFGAVSI